MIHDPDEAKATVWNENEDRSVDIMSALLRVKKTSEFAG